jgi:hypothetical protein
MPASEPFDWGALVDVADRLLARGERVAVADPLGAAADYRSAISRAYYAVRGAVLSKLDPEVRGGLDDVSRTGHVGHMQLWDHLRGHADLAMHVVGKGGRDLFLERVEADYRDHMADLHSRARYCVSLARALRDRLDALDRLGD